MVARLNDWTLALGASTRVTHSLSRLSPSRPVRIHRNLQDIPGFTLSLTLYLSYHTNTTKLTTSCVSSITRQVLKHAAVALVSILWLRGLEVWRATDDLGYAETVSVLLPWVCAVNKALVHRRMRGHPAVASQRQALR